MSLPSRCACAWLLLALASAWGVEHPLQDDVDFRNPSFEEDYENDGVPDRWEIPEANSVKLVPDASHGAKAPCFTDGYVLAAQNFYLANLAGRTLVVRVDVKGSDDAAFGCLAGFFLKRADASRKFIHSRLAWDRRITEDYQRLTLRYQFPDRALDGRVWIAFYRSNRKGTVWLDNVQAAARALSPEQRGQLTRLAREYGYLRKRSLAAAERFPDSAAALEGVAARAGEEMEAARDGMPALLTDAEQRYQDIAANHARINALFGAEPFHCRWAPACERLQPDAVPPPPGVVPQLVALRDEFVAVGIDLLNPLSSDLPLTLTVAVGEGVAGDLQLRRQVFMETWYKKAETRISDPLPLLSRGDAGWALTVPPGGSERLYLSMKTSMDAGPRESVRVTIGGPGGAVETLSCVVTVLPYVFPREPRFEHVQFMYPDKEPALSHPAEVARDLAVHGVSGIEFPYLPKVSFAPTGELVSADFAHSLQAEWMTVYGSRLPILMMFWEGRYKRFPVAGAEETFLDYTDEEGNLTPEFRRAYVELLAAWLEFARSRGFGVDRFLMLADDEPSSKEDVDNAPGKEVRRTLELYRLTRQAAPDLRIAVTLSDYATPPDVAVLAPAVDAIFPLWPYREKLTRWVPPDYRPRVAFEETIYPILARERETRGLDVWSYHIDPGKSAPVLTSARAYPLIAAGLGFTGVATWAYNVKRGQSWDDTDEGLLDYIFIYDGTEDHPLNKRVNPSGEIVVPSIRWEAMRLGWQDAQIVNWLRERAKARPDSGLKRRVDALLRPPALWARDPSKATFRAVRDIGRAARRLFAEIRSEDGN